MTNYPFFIEVTLVGLGLTLSFLMFYYQKKKYGHINRWKKSLHLPHHYKNFQNLYTSVNGFILSKQARAQYDAVDYIYGEIEFYPFIALLSLVKPNHNTVFYDLGCGVGKAVLACAMVFPCHKSIGVELFPELYHCANLQKQRLREQLEYKELADRVQFILGDFLETPLEEATILFINSSTLCEETWKQLSNRCNQLPHLEAIITTTKPLISTLFIPKIKTSLQMSWGIVYAYIHYKENKFSSKQLKILNNL